MPKHLLRATLLALALLPAGSQALEVAGIHFTDRTTLAGSELILNGAGLRSRLFIKIYAVGIYLPQKSDTADTALARTGPRRIQITTLRELSAEQLADALIDALEANHSPAELSRIAPRVAQLRSALLSLGKIAEKTTIRLDYLPTSGLRLQLGNDTRGNDIAGEDLYTALLKIWLGPKPVQPDLKDSLLGKP